MLDKPPARSAAVAAAQPDNPQAQEAYRNHCLLNGIDPSTGRESRFTRMSLAQIGEEWTREGQKVEAENLDAWRSTNAQVFLANEPAWESTPENAAKMEAELNRLGLKGSVADFQVCFDRLVKLGDIKRKPLPPAPLELPSLEEFGTMSAAEMKDYIEECNRKGIL